MAEKITVTVVTDFTSVLPLPLLPPSLAFLPTSYWFYYTRYEIREVSQKLNPNDMIRYCNIHYPEEMLTSESHRMYLLYVTISIPTIYIDTRYRMCISIHHGEERLGIVIVMDGSLRHPGM